MSQSEQEGCGWAGVLPAGGGSLYDPSHERDACGVGFIVNIAGDRSHAIVQRAVADVVVRMTHRGATGSDKRDGDGSGVMTSIPDEMLRADVKAQFDVDLPPLGTYATGNVYFNPDEGVRSKCIAVFEGIAVELGLSVICWRPVVRDSSVLGPVALSKEPFMLQPIVVSTAKNSEHNSSAVSAEVDQILFERKLFFLRKRATAQLPLKTWFYICSLSSKVITYKGLLNPKQLWPYFSDLHRPEYATHFALVHSRFSTNTFPSWDRAQPLRWCAHNGEINSLKGNRNRMRAREGVVGTSQLNNSELQKLLPIVEDMGSDSMSFDNVLELLLLAGDIPLPQAVMMMIPEAWQNHSIETMASEKRSFYEWASTVMEPWDGPALFTFSDGRYIGATLDRNGLRPARFYVTTDGFMICASEVGTYDVPPANVERKGRLQPGKMLLVDTHEKRIVDDAEIKMNTATSRPFAQWLKAYKITLDDLFSKQKKREAEVQALVSQQQQQQAGGVAFPVIRTPTPKNSEWDGVPLAEDPRMAAFNYTLETVNLLLAPMITDGKEALGSMGTDTPLACLSKQVRPLYDYFRQLFAQVTNPPIDPVREAIVMSLETFVGPEGNLLEMTAQQCNRLSLPSPCLFEDEVDVIRGMSQFYPAWTVSTVDLTFDASEGPSGYVPALDRVCAQVEAAIDANHKVAILSDTKASSSRVAVSALIAIGAVHQHLLSVKKRSKIALVLETAEAREVHHFCVLLGYGADAVCPYLAYDIFRKLRAENALKVDYDVQKLMYNYRKAVNDGVLKVMSKMGISTLHSYKGAQTFEALGIDNAVVDRCFAGTSTRIRGITFDVIAYEAFVLHERAYPKRQIVKATGALRDAGDYHWRSGGEDHINDPTSVANLQDAVRRKNQTAYDSYSKAAQESIRNCTLRGLLDIDAKECTPVPLDSVESWQSIVKRFLTGAMSFGSISDEAHSTVAIAMNRLGAKSNTGEGGEMAERSQPMANGDLMRSAVKQVASARFGVTSFYLSDAEDIQIKIAQGAKPGEGGELPGHKVTEDIAKTRRSVAGVGLISPPPHHDIYSIEDLKQLIFDLKSSNPVARISVKLVSEAGVGVVAAGVAKAKADHILISGHDGGTGASRWTGIKYAGMPWELGLAETHQTLVLNNLRGRVVVQTDGQIRTGRDVAVACLLGAEEFGFATTPLIALGCTMMRKCHLNTCPVGIATQDPELRKKFAGQPEHVINFFYYVAEEVRGIMAQLGFKSIPEMVGHAELLKVSSATTFNYKSHLVDLKSMLTPAHTLKRHADDAVHFVAPQNHELEKRLDFELYGQLEDAIANKTPTVLRHRIRNVDRAVGSTLSYHVSKKHGEHGLPEDTIKLHFDGSAGQSFGAFLQRGITMTLEGDANDYVGKGLSGGRIAVLPPHDSSFKSHENIIVGNVCLYGATGGQAFIRGVAAERFGVRNSGAQAVVEGCGDHGCEYMTGGVVVVLGATGRNFAAGMSGGYAFVYDPTNALPLRCNMDMVDLVPLESDDDKETVLKLLNAHIEYTQSPIASELVHKFAEASSSFVKVFPQDYRRVLEARKVAELEVKPVETAKTNGIHHDDHDHGHDEPDTADIEDSIADGQLLNKQLDKLKGFHLYKRKTDRYRNAKKRGEDFEEISHRLKPHEAKEQGARCMDCGVPFCQSGTGCPIANIIPKFNELVFLNNWRGAWEKLMATNNFPEFTGRVCPAPCEGACVLGINELPVAIKSIECAIIDRAYEEGWVVPNIPAKRTGKSVCVIGSGPAGLAAADQLNKAGHLVTVFERNDRVGGLLMYGIPNMKLDKKIVQRRIDLMAAEGVVFKTGVNVGKSIAATDLVDNYDAVVLATGATWPRDLQIPGRQLSGIIFAVDFLQGVTSSLLTSKLQEKSYIDVRDKNVIVIGGGDTGNDCIGTSVRLGATSVTNFELLPEPSKGRASDNPWPQFPRVFKVDYGHDEVKAHYGRDPREYCVLSNDFVSDDNGNVRGINTVKVEWTKDDQGRWSMAKVPNSEHFYPADIVFIAMGFLGPESEVLKQLNVAQDARMTNIVTPAGRYSTSVPKVFAAGDCRRGQSLVVWGINEGRMCARDVDSFLEGVKEGVVSPLPITGGIDLPSTSILNLASPNA